MVEVAGKELVGSEESYKKKSNTPDENNGP